MSAKTASARRAAFMAAVAETGNQALACERARVSRSWVTLHRSTDPAFRAELDAALATARERLTARRTGGGDMTPASGWRSIDGEELVVRGGNGRRTQIARARLKQWTPRVEARFLSALAACCNVKAACAAVGLSQASAYNHYRRWPAFAARWDEALETGYWQLDMAMLDHAGRAFETPEYRSDLPMPRMTVDEAIQLLRLHQARVHGAGKPPGRRRGAIVRSAEEVFESIAHKLDRVEKMRRAREAGDPAADPVANRRALARGARIVRGEGEWPTRA